MSLQNIVENELVQDKSSVWVLKEHQKFGYSDGAESERYLEHVFNSSKDLSSTSSELEQHIKDWASEYHLTTKRAQLLSGFTFDRGLKVLEVGCGCGAITRFLGETFDDVVSVEGSLNRARLARLRTRDLGGVSILCAPFQKIRFAKKFDIIFCIGVYEYSASFVEAQDPYEEVLRYFSDMLTPDGVVVIAIENQFGLKYFSSSREDHLGTMFEGVEGYHTHPGKVRTFGKVELISNLKKYFSAIDFYYPYPDYKLPDVVVSDEFMKLDCAGELISQMKSRDYNGNVRPLFNEQLATLELAKNGMLDFFANSFIAVAAKQTMRGVKFEQRAALFSSGRRPLFRTKTRVVNADDGGVVVRKALAIGSPEVSDGLLRLVATESPWAGVPSLHSIVYSRCKSVHAELTDIFNPCKLWVQFLKEKAVVSNGIAYLSGDYIDCIWSNVHPQEGEYQITDAEWVWARNVLLNVIVIRAIYIFLSKLDSFERHAESLQRRSVASLVREIASAIGVQLSEKDFREFVVTESEFQSSAFGMNRRRFSILLRWCLLDKPSLEYCQGLKRFFLRKFAALKSRIAFRRSRLLD
jgi:SAM-dependent methyltransferase